MPIPDSRNEDYTTVLTELVELHDRKSHDYANKDNPFSNFEFAAQYAGVTVGQVFDVLIGIKIARKMELNNKDPLNESRKDTEQDMTNYHLIKMAFFRREERRRGLDK